MPLPLLLKKQKLNIVIIIDRCYDETSYEVKGTAFQYDPLGAEDF